MDHLSQAYGGRTACAHRGQAEIGFLGLATSDHTPRRSSTALPDAGTLPTPTIRARTSDADD